MKPERILADLRQAAPDAILVTDVGWNKNGMAQQYPIDEPSSFITPGGFSTMGFGPAAVLGVAAARTGRPAIALVGDGGFGAQPNVVATAVEMGVAPIWVVMNNSSFGTIAGLERKHYGTSYGCDFEVDGQPYTPDFSQMARACGAEGWKIGTTDELLPTLQRAVALGRPVLVDVPMENTPVPTPGSWDIERIYRLPGPSPCRNGLTDDHGAGTGPASRRRASESRELRQAASSPLRSVERSPCSRQRSGRGHRTHPGAHAGARRPP